MEYFFTNFKAQQNHFINYVHVYIFFTNGPAIFIICNSNSSSLSGKIRHNIGSLESHPNSITLAPLVFNFLNYKEAFFTIIIKHSVHLLGRRRDKF